MATIDWHDIADTDNILEPQVQEMIYYMADDIMTRIEKNFKRLGISPFNPNVSGGKFTGELMRSIHWEVYNRSGGNEILVRFYMQNIANFVELATQRKAHATQLEEIPGMNYEGISRADDAGKPMKRKAKPFIAGELRLHGRMMFDRLVRHYGYVGNMLLAIPFLEMAEESAAIQIKQGGWDLKSEGGF